MVLLRPLLERLDHLGLSVVQQRVDNGVNVFRAEAKLSDSDPSLRPGLEGIVKLDVGRAPLIWIWSRSFVEWARLTLWKLLP